MRRASRPLTRSLSGCSTEGHDVTRFISNFIYTRNCLEQGTRVQVLDSSPPKKRGWSPESGMAQYPRPGSQGDRVSTGPVNGRTHFNVEGPSLRRPGRSNPL